MQGNEQLTRSQRITALLTQRGGIWEGTAQELGSLLNTTPGSALEAASKMRKRGLIEYMSRSRQKNGRVILSFSKEPQPSNSRDRHLTENTVSETTPMGPVVESGQIQHEVTIRLAGVEITIKPIADKGL